MAAVLVESMKELTLKEPEAAVLGFSCFRHPLKASYKGSFKGSYKGSFKGSYKGSFKGSL